VPDTPRGAAVTLPPVESSSKRYEAGALLPGPRATLGGPSFDEWLDLELPRATKRADPTAAPAA
jgi:hypothetical protein